MKKGNYLLVAFIILSTTAMAQTELYRSKIQEKNIPEKILQSLEKDFPDVDIVKYEGLPLTMIDGELYVDSDENIMDKHYDDYVITLDGKSGIISATYDSEGELVSTFERLKNIALPEEILISIGHQFPGWAIKGDRYRMKSYRGGKEIAHYKVWLEKGGKKQEVLLDQSGKIIRAAKHPSTDTEKKEVG